MRKFRFTVNYAKPIIRELNKFISTLDTGLYGFFTQETISFTTVSNYTEDWYVEKMKEAFKELNYEVGLIEGGEIIKWE